MKVEFACPGCGAKFAAEASQAGKSAPCRRCGERVTVPRPKAHPEDEDDGTLYDLAEPLPAARAVAVGESSFVRARADPDTPGRGGRPRPTSKAREARRHADVLDPIALLKKSAPYLAASVVLLAVVAAFAPHGPLIVGGAVAAVGFGLFAYGYATCVYIAFTEDSLYGILFLLFPFYAAYYVVSRWDDVWTRAALVLGGTALLTLGGWISGVADMNQVDARPPGLSAPEAP